jgi:NAD(P)-dependent dehydrogenase (short-subunit alcohol dehydrogenase family)
MIRQDHATAFVLSRRTVGLRWKQQEEAMSKVWFITGSNSGIGLGIAKSAIEQGDRVVATGRNMEKLCAAFAGVGSDDIELAQLDVAVAAQADAAIQQAIKRFGRVDVLVNNAGYSILGNFEELTAEDFHNLFQVNFYGVVNVLRAALPILRKQRSGHIINVSSTAGAVGLKHCSAYCATKFAVEGLSTALATEVEQFGINVTIIEPGFFRTKLIDKGSVKYAPSTIADYAHEGSAEDMWSKYSGLQPNDPVKLGKIIVQIAAAAKPLKLFVAGPDALELVTPVIEERLKTMHENAELSKSTTFPE